MGIFTFFNEDCYTGEFKDGRRNGYGLFKYDDGSVDQGSWMNDEKHGLVIIKEDNTLYYTLYEEGEEIKEFN